MLLGAPRGRLDGRRRGRGRPARRRPRSTSGARATSRRSARRSSTSRRTTSSTARSASRTSSPTRRTRCRSYGRTKLTARARQASGLDRALARGCSGWTSKNFVRTMLELGAKRDEVAVVDDQRGSSDLRRPSGGGDAASCSSFRSGVYHVAADGDCTWAEFAEAIFEEAGLDCRVRRITTAELGRPAPRPANCGAAQREGRTGSSRTGGRACASVSAGSLQLAVLLRVALAACGRSRQPSGTEMTPMMISGQMSPHNVVSPAPSRIALRMPRSAYVAGEMFDSHCIQLGQHRNRVVDARDHEQQALRDEAELRRPSRARSAAGRTSSSRCP